MPERLRQLFNNAVAFVSRLSLPKRIFLAALVVILIVGAYFSLTYSTKVEYTYLFKKPISLKEIGVISAELERLNIPFEILEDKYIVVADEATGTQVRIELAQNDLLPASIKGWELFDMDSWTTTEFDRNVKLRRAIQGEIRKHIESLNWVDSAQVSISVPEDTLYTDRASDVEAAISLVAAEGYSDRLKDPKVIKGIENLVARGIDGLARENIVITDATGNQINFFPEESYELQIKQAVEENKVKDHEINKIKKKIETSLHGVLPRDRFRVAVDLELRFDKVNIKQKEILPVVIKKRTPNLPYDDSVIKENVKVSSKTLKENFEGLGFIPEGPPGQEPNLPPGYKESLEGKNIYNKDEAINNYVNGERVLDQQEDATEIIRKSVSVTVDGIWDYEYNTNGARVLSNNKLVRNYTVVSVEELQKFRDIVQGAINYNVERGDSVVVENIQFDRTKQFAEEDAIYLRNYRIRLALIYGSITILSIILLIVIIHWIRNLIEQYRIAKAEEEELLRKLQRERALRDFDDMEISETPPSQQEQESIRLTQEIEALIRENPQQTARVISTVMSEKN
ncbi:flagellar M-ring protein [Spirochaetota bacterium]|nr:flagellar M-ring protein [Spirochaetota bacterium]